MSDGKDNSDLTSSEQLAYHRLCDWMDANSRRGQAEIESRMRPEDVAKVHAEMDAWRKSQKEKEGK